MTQTEATAEIFWTALKALPAKARQAVLRRLVQDENLRHDLIDSALIEERLTEPVRSFRAYLKDSRRRK